MSGRQNHPAITGQWTRADDSSNALELAETDRGDVFAVRDTFDQGEVIYATGKQLRNLADAVQKGHMRNLINR